jgi:uncharacterized Zn-binding protein involved in type VI secretion
MAGPLIRLGDKTSHGGAVIQASSHSDTGGAVLIAGQQATVDKI